MPIAEGSPNGFLNWLRNLCADDDGTAQRRGQPRNLGRMPRHHMAGIIAVNDAKDAAADGQATGLATLVVGLWRGGNVVAAAEKETSMAWRRLCGGNRLWAFCAAQLGSGRYAGGQKRREDGEREECGDEPRGLIACCRASSHAHPVSRFGAARSEEVETRNSSVDLSPRPFQYLMGVVNETQGCEAAIRSSIARTIARTP